MTLLISFLGFFAGSLFGELFDESVAAAVSAVVSAGIVLPFFSREETDAFASFLIISDIIIPSVKNTNTKASANNADTRQR